MEVLNGEWVFSSVLTDLKNNPSEVAYSERVCPKHGKYTAKIMHFNGSEIACACPVCEEEQKRIEQCEFERAERKRHIKHCEECNIEPEFYFKTIADFVPKSDSQKIAFEAVKKMISEKHGKIVLLGGNGVGKTMLASIAAKELNGKIYTMYEISTMIRQSYTVKADKSELEIVRSLISLPFLAIDEIGRSKGSLAEQNWLSEVLNKRHSRRLPFMLLGNGHFKSMCPNHGCNKCFENFVDSDILSRLQSDSSVIMIIANDERKTQGF